MRDEGFVAGSGTTRMWLGDPSPGVKGECVVERVGWIAQDRCRRKKPRWGDGQRSVDGVVEPEPAA